MFANLKTSIQLSDDVVKMNLVQLLEKMLHKENATKFRLLITQKIEVEV